MLKKPTVELSIISPVHNEEALVGSFVANAVTYLRKNKIAGEVIIVENGSKDRTLATLNSLSKKYPELVVLTLPTGNKGLALKAAILKAKGEKIITLDTDLWSERFVKTSRTKLDDYDVVVGSRSVSGGKDKRPLFARLLNAGYYFPYRLFFNFKGTNTHAQLSFCKDKIVPLVKQCQTADLNFDTELILRAERAGLSKIEIPTVVKEIRARRYSLVKQLINTAKNFLLLLKTLGPSLNWPYVLLALSLALGAFLRFYHYRDWFFFSVDEEHYSFMTRMITVNHHFPLIGGPISGTKLYMAPWFLYFNGIFFLLSNNNPVVSGMVFAGLELMVIPLVYLIGKKIFSPAAGAIAAVLYGGSMLMAIFGRHYWNITLTPLYSALTFYALLRYLDGSKKWLIIAALVVGFGMSATFSVFAVFLFAFLVILLFKRSVRDILVFLGIVAATNVPLVLFDLRHNFFLLSGILDFLTTHTYDRIPLIQRVGETATVFIQTLGKALAMVSPVDLSNETSICYQSKIHQTASVWTQFAAIFFLASFIGSAIKARTNKKYYLLVILLALVNFASLFLFRADPAERHFLPFLPLFFLIIGIVLAKLGDKFGLIARKVIAIFVVVILVLNFLSFIRSNASYGIADKEAAVQDIISKTAAGTFYFEGVGDCHKWGYRYLFSEFNHEPTASYLDDSFSWMYSKLPQPQNTLTKVTISAPDNGRLAIYYSKTQ